MALQDVSTGTKPGSGMGENVKHGEVGHTLGNEDNIAGLLCAQGQKEWALPVGFLIAHPVLLSLQATRAAPNLPEEYSASGIFSLTKCLFPDHRRHFLRQWPPDLGQSRPT